MSKVAIADKDTGKLIYSGNGRNPKVQRLRSQGHQVVLKPVPSSLERPAWDAEAGDWAETPAPAKEPTALEIICAEVLAQGAAGKRTQAFIDLCARMGVS